jgi:hypothetical protein
MIAAFLKAPDGEFDFRQPIILLFCICVGLFAVRQIYKGFKTGRVLFGIGVFGSPISRIDREKSPVGFWFAVAFYFLGLAMLSTIAVTFCFLGLLGKLPD